MFQESPSSQPQPQADRLITADAPRVRQSFSLVGYLLVAVGVGVIAYVLTEIYGVYTAYASLSSNSFISAITARLTHAPIYSKNELDFVTLGSGTAEVIAFLLFILLASLGISTGFRIIKCGSYLMSPQVEPQVERMQKSVDGLRAELGQFVSKVASRLEYRG